MMAGICISQKIFAIDVLTALKILFGASSKACSAIFTTIWSPGFSEEPNARIARLDTGTSLNQTSTQFKCVPCVSSCSRELKMH